MIKTIYSEKPTWSAQDNHADCHRYEINGLFIDATSEPTPEEIDAVLNPPQHISTKEELINQINDLSAKVNALK